jgi:hypothetical protein
MLDAFYLHLAIFAASSPTPGITSRVTMASGIAVELAFAMPVGSGQRTADLCKLDDANVIMALSLDRQEQSTPKGRLTRWCPPVIVPLYDHRRPHLNRR